MMQTTTTTTTTATARAETTAKTKFQLDRKFLQNSNL
jgi:hypothetical protein